MVQCASLCTSLCLQFSNHCSTSLHQHTLQLSHAVGSLIMVWTSVPVPWIDRPVYGMSGCTENCYHWGKHLHFVAMVSSTMQHTTQQMSNLFYSVVDVMYIAIQVALVLDCCNELLGSVGHYHGGFYNCLAHTSTFPMIIHWRSITTTNTSHIHLDRYTAGAAVEPTVYFD